MSNGERQVIRREDVDAGRIDFSDIATGSRIPLCHPGEILREEFLEAMEITAYRLAKEIKVPLTRIAAILKGKRSITADTSLRLGRYFNMSPGFWLRMQAAYDMELAQDEIRNELEEIEPLKQANA
jgi:addiction module HigA family antidote